MGKLQLKLLKKFLDKKNINYKVIEHEPVFSSEEAAKVRGIELKTGVKAMLLNTQENQFILGLIAADRRFDFKKLAKIVNTKKLGMASPKSVLKTMGCEVGCVHPFGNLENLPTFLDISILENEDVILAEPQQKVPNGSRLA